MEFREKLKQLRTDRGYTLKETALKLGLSQNAFANYEAGIREPSLSILKKICDVFDVSADYLLGRTDY
ncbi:MAG: helix-turn-helix transcriptional regulator [Clostridia bacterium]|nr:helix-turn-helix transcriptional regulator [Clostridia bacterium]